MCTPTAVPSPTQAAVSASKVVATSTPTPEPDLGAVAPANLARLGRFVESTTGRRFAAGTPPVSFLQPSHLGTSSVEELLPAKLWNLLQVSGLVDDAADRELAAQAWNETARGQYCPVVVVDGHDRVSNEIIIVHEMTHALDWPMIRRPSDREIVAPERAIVEGNAHRLAYLYANTLVDADFVEAPGLFADINDPRMPETLRAIFEYPYDQGKQFVEAVAARGGEDAVVDAFTRPPVAVEVLDPDLWFEQVDFELVPTPTHLVLDPISEQGQLGAFHLQLMLELSLDPVKARQLATKWRGDAYAFTATRDRHCIAIAITTSTPTAARQVAAELAAIPEASATASGQKVEFSRCRHQTS